MSYLDVDRRHLVIDCVYDGARQSLHSSGGVFKQLSLDDALDLCDERVRVVVGVAVDFVLVKADLQHLCQDPGVRIPVSSPYFEVRMDTSG